MKCASCNRLLFTATVMRGRQAFGPICARRMGLSATKNRANSARNARAKARYLEENQMDLFEGIV
jgi:hypothetical protein